MIKLEQKILIHKRRGGIVIPRDIVIGSANWKQKRPSRKADRKSWRARHFHARSRKMESRGSNSCSGCKDRFSRETLHAHPWRCLHLSVPGVKGARCTINRRRSWPDPKARSSDRGWIDSFEKCESGRSFEMLIAPLGCGSQQLATRFSNWQTFDSNRCKSMASILFILVINRGGGGTRRVLFASTTVGCLSYGDNCTRLEFVSSR